MSTNKSSLIPVIIQCIGLFFTIITVFLGAYYALNGEIIISSLISILIVTALFFLVDRLVNAKKKNNIKHPLTAMFIVTFTIISVIASFFVLHFFNIEINEKVTIQALGDSKLKSLTDMVVEYDKQADAYKNKVDTDLSILLKLLRSASPASGYRIRSLLGDKPYNIPIQTINDYYYSHISERAVIDPVLSLIKNNLDLASIDVRAKNKTHLDKFNGTFTNWSRLHLCQALHETDELLKSNFKQLYTSLKNNTTPARDFYFTYPTQKPLISKPILLWQKHSPIVLILVAVLFQILIILPLLVASYDGPKRVDKKGGKGATEVVDVT